MNFKRNCLLITSLIACLGALSSCSNTVPYTHVTYISEKEDLHKDEIFEDGKIVRYGDYESYYAFGEKNLGSASNVMRKFGEKKLMSTTGRSKMIVIPVEFKDFTVDQLGVSKNKYIEDLNKAFFGCQENNTYVSVSDFFNRSSYGKLRIDGKVVDQFYTFPKSVQEIKTGISRDVLTTYYKDIIEWYKTKYDDIDKYIIKGLESESDPSVACNVPIFLVYTYPIELSSANSDFFWAYTFNSVPLSWASYSFMYTENAEPDAHTFIHETGHLLGLVDYYPTNESSTATIPDPTARIDMMDCSVGDETGFSKMYLDWTRPYHVTDSTSMILKPFSENGDLVLLKDTWNKSVFDEYFLIEFYSPTGLNAFDSTIGNSQAKLPSLPGIKVYHVDSRLGYFKHQRSGLEFDCYCELSTPSALNEVVDFAHDNNTYPNTKLINEKNYLYELVLNNTSERISGCAQNAHLYRQGDVISSLKLSNGTSLNYKISVSSLNFKEANIKIEKII